MPQNDETRNLTDEQEAMTLEDLEAIELIMEKYGYDRELATELWKKWNADVQEVDDYD